MSPLSSLEESFWYLGLILKAAIVWRLAALGLFRRYLALSLCVGFQVLRTLTLLTLDVNTETYFFTYVASLPLLLISYVLVALEIYSQAFAAYRGLVVAGRRAMLTLLAISAAAALILHQGQLSGAGEPFQVIRAMLLIESAISLMLLIFLTVIAAFLLWYPSGIRRNLLVYSFSFSLYTAVQTAIVFLRNIEPAALTRAASTLRLGVEDLCYLALAVLLRAAWENVPARTATGLTAAHTGRLLVQLGQLNAALEGRGGATRSR